MAGSDNPDDQPGPDPACAVSVLYFAALRDLTGTGEEQVELPTLPFPVSGLLELLQQKHASLSGRLSTVRVAVNEEFSELDRTVQGGDVVALIPPVSGG